MSENESENLSPRQWRAVREILVQKTVASAAAQCRVSQATIYRWLGDQAFRTALTQAETEAVNAAGRRLVALTEAALDAVVTILNDPQVPAAVRLKAAETVLSNMLRFREIVMFEARLTELEREVRGQPDA